MDASTLVRTINTTQTNNAVTRGDLNVLDAVGATFAITRQLELVSSLTKFAMMNNSNKKSKCTATRGDQRWRTHAGSEREPSGG